MKSLEFGLILGSLILTTVVYAANDYSNYSIEELAKMRGTLRNTTQEEKDAFREAWQEKLRSLNPEKRQTYTRRGLGSGQRRGNGNGTCNRSKYGGKKRYRAGENSYSSGVQSSMVLSHGHGRFRGRQ